jgi:septal ring factor EnvC (AmiA/AmiB activator)
MPTPDSPSLRAHGRARSDSTDKFLPGRKRAKAGVAGARRPRLVVCALGALFCAVLLLLGLLNAAPGNGRSGLIVAALRGDGGKYVASSEVDTMLLRIAALEKRTAADAERMEALQEQLAQRTQTLEAVEADAERARALCEADRKKLLRQMEEERHEIEDLESQLPKKGPTLLDLFGGGLAGHESGAEGSETSALGAFR